MTTFLFWNIAKNHNTFPAIARILKAKKVDVLLLAECPGEQALLFKELMLATGKEFRDLSLVFKKVRLITSLPGSAFSARFTSESNNLCIWRMTATHPGNLLLALVHLPAKIGGVDETDQSHWAGAVAREVAEIEDDEKCFNTVLIGDFNMNPFDPGMVNVMGLHGLMTRDLAGLPERTHQGRSYRRFYNPMWGLFGDRTPGPPGTFFWHSSVPSNQHWHILDQVLVRPSLMDRLVTLQILDHDGYDSLLTSSRTIKEDLSDHLPIVFTLDI